MTIAKKLPFVIIIASLLVTGITVFAVYMMQSATLHDSLLEKTKSTADQYISVRHIIAMNQDAINTDSMGNFEFKALNPARVGNMVAQNFNLKSHMVIKQTSLKVRNKEMGQPDEFEKEWLKKFEDEKSMEPISEETILNGEPVFRYMVPIEIKKPCLSCHGEPAGEIDISGYPKEGYKEGEIRGAISVIAPMKADLSNLNRHMLIVGAAGLFLALILIVILHVFFRSMVTSPIAALMDKADKISMGEVSEPIEVMREDEIGALAQSFERMRISLKKSLELIEKD
ncbi:DUF3365 domain-containing protein [Myxococcota bacterium]|nr:DUF3365 domain-containing protein [Myxococcota bacterium]MBU1897458.1 DUF3365 domain-containing protein [Myxococcota bacterium]